MLGCRNVESVVIVLTVTEDLLCVSFLVLQVTGSAVVHSYQNILRNILLESEFHLLLGPKPQTSHQTYLSTFE
jgi:hypothetical protein